MARAESAPVPAMSTAMSTGNQIAGTANPADTGTTRSRKQRNLGGAWGASFVGDDGYGKPVVGLSWPRRNTTPGIHPYDEIEWETRTAFRLP